jgi:ACS family 4-hydroxyphenylacetate permease-like MFS transporter
MSVADAASTQAAIEARIYKKVAWRLLWFLLVMYVINFIDRTNVGFAALTMNKELGISASTFGVAVAAFSTAYLLCEIPSNLILARVGARTWLARIMVSWGLASAACMFIVGAWSLIGLRLLVGICEAGFAPGVVLYLTYWFPQFHRARAHTGYMMAQPISNVIGATISGVLIGMNGVLGLAGWRWVFLLEGLPAVLIGVIAYFYLTDRPSEAKWLSAEEKSVLAAALKRDADEREAALPAGPKRSVTRLILSRNFLLISIAYGCLIGNNNALAVWTPQILRAATSPDMSLFMIGLLTAIPPFCALVAMPLVTFHSDRKKERFWHCVLPMLFAAAGWALAASTATPGWQLVGISVAAMGCVSAWPVFFTLPSAILPRPAHPAGIAFLNTIGLLGAAVTPMVMGFMRDLTGSFAGPMGVMGAFLVVGVGLMVLVPRALLAGGDSEAMPGGAAPAATRP